MGETEIIGGFLFFFLIYFSAQGIKTGACDPAGSCSILHGAAPHAPWLGV